MILGPWWWLRVGGFAAVGSRNHPPSLLHEWLNWWRTMTVCEQEEGTPRQAGPQGGGVGTQRPEWAGSISCHSWLSHGRLRMFLETRSRHFASRGWMKPNSAVPPLSHAFPPPFLPSPTHLVFGYFMGLSKITKSRMHGGTSGNKRLKKKKECVFPDLLCCGRLPSPPCVFSDPPSWAHPSTYIRVGFRPSLQKLHLS